MDKPSISVQAQAASMIRKIKVGLKEDIDMLLDQFDKGNSVRFIDFARCWRDNHFSFIFAFKLNEAELREFIEDAFLIVLDQFTSSLSSEKAIATLYMLYCLYISQPIDPKMPIKLVLSKYKLFRSLYHQLQVNGHIDACYVWLKLIALGAFNFVAREKPYGPTSIVKKINSSSISSSDNSSLFEGNSKFDDYINELKHIHEHYQRMKTNLEGGDVSQIKELDFVKDSLFEEYANLVEKSRSDSIVNQPEPE